MMILVFLGAFVVIVAVVRALTNDYRPEDKAVFRDVSSAMKAAKRKNSTKRQPY